MTSLSTAIHDINEKLDVDGYAVIRGHVPAELLRQHRATIEPLARRLDLFSPNPLPLSPSSYRKAMEEFGNVHLQNEATLQICFDPLIRALAEYRLGGEMVLRYPTTGAYAPIDPSDSFGNPHHDYLGATAASPWTSELRVWCALEDVDRDAGPFYVIPGSHMTISPYVHDEVLRRHPCLIQSLLRSMMPNDEEVLFENVRELFQTSYAFLASRESEQSSKRKVLVLRQGDIVIFNPSLIHGTCPRLEASLERWHLLFFAASKITTWYSWRSWWGDLHDHRCAENAVPFEITRGNRGLYVSNHCTATRLALTRKVRRRLRN